jgi:hypothetical protein
VNATVDIEYQEYAQAFSEFIRERGALLPKALRGEGRQVISSRIRNVHSDTDVAPAWSRAS